MHRPGRGGGRGPGGGCSGGPRRGARRPPRARVSRGSLSAGRPPSRPLSTLAAVDACSCARIRPAAGSVHRPLRPRTRPPRKVTGGERRVLLLRAVRRPARPGVGRGPPAPHRPSLRRRRPRCHAASARSPRPLPRSAAGPWLARSGPVRGRRRAAPAPGPGGRRPSRAVAPRPSSGRIQAAGLFVHSYHHRAGNPGFSRVFR